MLLDWLATRHGRPAFAAAAQAIDAAIDALLKDPARRTPDLGGPLGTKAFTEALCEELRARAS